MDVRMAYVTLSLHTTINQPAFPLFPSTEAPNPIPSPIHLESLPSLAAARRRRSHGRSRRR